MTPARSSDGLTENQKGLLYALCCYLLWGLFPLYWYPLTHSGIDAGQLLAQRIVWSALFSVVLVAVFKQTHVLLDALRRPKTLLVFTCSATAIGLNWLIFLWAISNNHVLEASLGYFISPLFSMLLGRLLFNEHFNRIQLAAMVLAANGIFWLALPAGQVPWVALLLTLTFGLYGLLRKRAPVDAVGGLFIETLVVAPLAIAWLLWLHAQGSLAFGSGHPAEWLLPLTGVILTKMDGDSRGGAALSVRQTTGKPIKFIGIGEKVNGLEPFHPDRIASRILGMGDVLTLIEDVQKGIDEEVAAKMAKKLHKGKGFDLNDFKEQIQQMRNMGGLESIMSKMPGEIGQLSKQIPEGTAEKAMGHVEAIINSMTAKERANPALLKASRKRRIAAGSGTTIQEVNKMLKQFEQSQQMMKMFSGKGMGKLMNMAKGMKGKFPGM